MAGFFEFDNSKTSIKEYSAVKTHFLLNFPS